MALLDIVQHIQQRLQCSILPLNGKRPAPTIKTWTQFRSTRPTTDQLSKWFTHSETTAYGIILGKSANGLFVVDFDDSREYRGFREAYPEVNQTFTTRTPRGYHVYLRTNEYIPSSKINGGDIKGEGSYVVGPGSTVAGASYTIHHDTRIQTLTKEKTHQILKHTKIKSKRRKVKQQTPSQTTAHIRTTYQTQAPRLGRNNALYKTAVQARATGISQQQTIKELATLHTTTEPIGQHATETKQVRYKEALATIQSAYKGTSATRPNPSTPTGITTKGLLPNTIREALLQEHKSTVPGRLIEGCIIEGWRPSQQFTLRDAQRVGRRYQIGEKQVREAITGKYNQTTKNTPIYIRNPNPITHKSTPPVWDSDSKTEKSLSLPSSGESNVVSLDTYVPEYVPSEGGRKPQIFVFPDLDYLCRSFDVVPMASDFLSFEDLQSPKSYLMALHRELVLRLCPEYSIEWHAKRLGVSERTIRRYNNELGVIVTPIFEYRLLNWDNVDNPDFWKSSIRINVNGQDITPGQWIQRSDGKRFPAIKGVALDWMARSQDDFVMCYRRPSRLQLPQADHPIIVHDVIWRCVDTMNQSEWGGDAYDFPPIDKSVSVPTSSKIINMTPDIVNTKSLAEPDVTKILGLKIGEIGVGLLEDIPPEGIEARHRLGFATYEHLNLSLQLVIGLGPSRIDQLNDHGIFTLEQLILVGSERLFNVISWRGREYLSAASCDKWIEAAKILLGWKQLHPQVVAEQKLRQEAQKVVREYKKNFQRFIDYLKSLHEWENEVFDTGHVMTLSWNRLLLWCDDLLRRCENDGNLFLEPRSVHSVHETVREFCVSYMKRIDVFLAKADWELEEYMLGDRKKWKALARATSRQFARFEFNAVWPEWN